MTWYHNRLAKFCSTRIRVLSYEKKCHKPTAPSQTYFCGEYMEMLFLFYFEIILALNLYITKTRINIEIDLVDKNSFLSQTVHMTQ